MAEGISYKTAAFEGPLDLLLYLIQKSEINIYDIPIAEITDQFMHYMKSEAVTSLGDISDFYKMAADLLWIKSRMLLPVDIEFDEEYEDPRKELVQRLLDYQKFKKYSQLLFGSERQGELLVERRKAQFMLPFSDEELWHDADVVDLLRTYADLMGKIDSLSHKVFNIYEEVTINEKVTLMNELLESNDVIHFTDVIVKINSPEHVISAFLAVLESVKDCLILIRQDADYGDIAIWRRPDGYEAMPPDGVEADADRE